MQILYYTFSTNINRFNLEGNEIFIGREVGDQYDIVINNVYRFREKKNVNTELISWVQKTGIKYGYELQYSSSNPSYYNQNDPRMHIICRVVIEKDKLLERFKKNIFSQIEKDFFRSLFSKKVNYDNIKTLWKDKWTPDTKISNQPKKIKAKLFKHQLESLNWMKEVEKSGSIYKLDSKRKFSEILDDEDFQDNYMDMYSDEINNHDETHIFRTNGGILADEMGLGKTLTTISLISEKEYVYRPNKIDEDFRYEVKNIGDKEYLVTKATLIICPSHLTKQWSNEIKENCPNLKHISILTKTNHDKYTLQDMLNSDVVITSFQFLNNINYYVNYLNKIDANQRRYTQSYLYGSNLKIRFNDMVNYNKFSKKVIECSDIIFESIYWNRVVIDEAHELFKTGGYSNYYSSETYEQYFFKKLKCNNKWYISGTPFFDKNSLINVMNFLDFETEIKVSGNRKYTINLEDSLNYGLSGSNILNSVLSQIYIRNTKESVKDQLTIPSSIFEDIFIDLTDFEDKIYRSYEAFGTQDYLRRICCNIQICEKFNNGNMDNILNFDEVKEQLIKENEEKIKKTKVSLELLNEDVPGYLARKKMLENIINSCNFFLKCISTDKFEVKEESCPICKCDFEDPVITQCGHHYCYECICEVLNAPSNKKECPICRADLKNANMFKLNSNNENKKNENIDELVYKYGTKMSKLIKLCKQILLNKNNKIIIFSEWDRLLTMIGTILSKNEIDNIFCKGNVHQRNNTISRFRKKNGTDRVIMLSTENAASGTNLTEATHIIFMEPHIGTYGAVKAIEDQAVGRAERLGQENQVTVHRLITRNTIEEKIFKEFLLNKEKIGEESRQNIDTEIVANI